MKCIISDPQSMRTDVSETAKTAEHSAALLRMGQITVFAPDRTAIAIQLIEFDSESFRLEDFSASAIQCPAGITRSVHKRRAEFYFGRLAARRALAALDIDAFDVQVGKMREPVWPTGVVGSISHVQNRAAAVAMHCDMRSGMGVDLERVIGADTCAVLSSTVIGECELRYLSSLMSALPMRTLLTIVFSAKESFFKAVSATVGRYFDFHAVRVTHVDLAQGCLRLQLVETLSDVFVENKVCEAGFSFVDPDTVLTHFSW